MLSGALIFVAVQSMMIWFSIANVPVISRHELLQRGAVFFTKQGVDTYTSLLYDTAELRHDILVGARNHMFRFDEYFGLQEFIELAPTAGQTQICTKNHTMADCHNFIHVMVHSELIGVNMIFACSTNAFAPVCNVRHGGQISTKLDTLDGMNWLPSNPHVRTAAYLGERLFLGTALGDVGKNVSFLAIDLLNPTSTDNFVTTKDSTDWLYNAEFVEAFQYDTYVYFVFREVAIESPGGEIYSRIGRICEDDKGKNGHWSSFTKARLQCGDLDTVQGAKFLPATRTLYASFISDAGASAVCTFDYSAIDDTFNGPYKCREDANSTWESCPVPKPQNHEPTVSTCFGARTIPALSYILMWKSILPKCGGPVYKVLDRHFSVIDVVEDLPGGPFALVGDHDGRVMKLESLECGKTRPLEIWEVTQSNDPTKNINVLSVHHSLVHSVFLLMDNGVMKVPLEDLVPTTITSTKFTTSATTNSRGPKTITTTPTSQGVQTSISLLLMSALCIKVFLSVI